MSTFSPPLKWHFCYKSNFKIVELTLRFLDIWTRAHEGQKFKVSHTVYRVAQKNFGLERSHNFPSNAVNNAITLSVFDIIYSGWGRVHILIGWLCEICWGAPDYYDGLISERKILGAAEIKKEQTRKARIEPGSLASETGALATWATWAVNYSVGLLS